MPHTEDFPEKQKVYSHSKLSMFEQCPFKYKCRYIDHLQPDFEQSIEAHLGVCVHETLEWLYTLVNKENKAPPIIDAVIEHYSLIWAEKFKEDLKIVSQTKNLQEYFNNGVQFLVDYYMKHQPFRDGTLDMEMEVQIDLYNDGKYLLRGYVDRLVFNKETGEYEIHDYKTGSLPRDKNKFDTDRQLALYSIAIKEIFGKEQKVCLVWHYLAHDHKFCVYKTDEQLEALKFQIKELIEKIQSSKNFNTNVSALCNWCEFRSKCPVWKKN